MTLPDISKGGKPCRDTAKNLRRRSAKGKELAPAEAEWLANWEARVAAMPKGRPVKTEADNDSQAGTERQPADAAGNPTVPPSNDPVDPAASGNSDPAPPPPPIEAPPRVAPVAHHVIASSPTGDWRAKHRAQIQFSGDGRQMLCESLAEQWALALGALVDDMAKAGIAPIAGIDPRLPQVKSLATLAFDELLPEKAKLSPKIGLVVVTTATIGKRAYHHKAITEALKKDPATVEWQRKQEEREAADKAAHAARAEQAKQATAQPEPKYAEPAPAPEVARPVNGQPFNSSAPRSQPVDRDTSPLL